MIAAIATLANQSRAIEISQLERNGRTSKQSRRGERRA